MSTAIHIDDVIDHEVLLPEQLGFGRHFSTRMFTQRYNAERGWHAPRIGAYAPITLDPAATVYHNEQMIFDGTKDPGQNYLYIRLFLSGCRGVAILGNSPAIARQSRPASNHSGTPSVLTR